MAVIDDKPVWEDKITQIDPNDPVQGGAGGVDNVPHEQLANRTAYLKQEIEGIKGDSTEPVTLELLLQRIKELEADRTRLAALEARTYEDTQIGEHIWTSQHFLTPEAVTTYKGYGVWERALQGRVAVGFSDNPDDIIEFRTHGAEYGESEHTLTVEESASHKHPVTAFHENGGQETDTDGYFALNSIGSGVKVLHLSSEPDNSKMMRNGTGNSLGGSGGDQPHNNIQQSKTLDCWKRIA